VIINKFNAKIFGSLSILISILAVVGVGQETKTNVIYNKNNRTLAVAEGNNLYCAGYIQTSPINTGFELIGADNESEQYVYSENAMVYVNQGSSSGIKVGDVFSVVRPRGPVRSKFSGKGKLGFLVEEVGAVEIVKVKDSVSVARVKTSCDNFLLGDLLQPMETRVAPTYTQRPALDVFAEASGKAVGRIVMAREAREVLGTEQIVYIDLGSEDNVKAGDFLTIFRPLGKTKITKIDEEEMMPSEHKNYGSETFQGNRFSIMAPRKEGGTAGGSKVTTPEAKTSRPNNLRKVVGEMLILSVKERTATALIVRNAQEIHTGDMVEIQ
jgi:hypothetical protein